MPNGDRPRTSLWVSVALVLGAAWTSAQEVGPANGLLVVVGGSMRDPAIVERFLRLAGGADVPIVVIPMAGGGEAYDQLLVCGRSRRPEPVV